MTLHKAVVHAYFAVAIFVSSSACTTTHAQVLVDQDIFIAGQEGPDGSPRYRIPSIIQAADGSLLTFVQGRFGSGDPGRGPGGIALHGKRSTDRGQTWSNLMVILSEEDSQGTLWDWNAWNPVVMQPSGDLGMFAARWPDSVRTTELFWMTSSDGGQNWSSLTDVTAIKPAGWEPYDAGPGRSIQLQWQANPARNGRLVYSGKGVDPSSGSWTPYPFYSDDLGSTFVTANPVDSGPIANENEIVELTNGDLLLDGRQNSGSVRHRYLSQDGGLTWSFYTSSEFNITKVDGSMIRYSAKRSSDDRDRLLFSGPLGTNLDPNTTSGKSRNNIAIWTSYDEGLTFINPIHSSSGYAGYSALEKLDDGTIGLFYESQANARLRYIRLGVGHLEGASHDATMTHFDGFGNRVDSLRGGVGWSGSWSANGNVNQHLGGLEYVDMAVADDTHRVQFVGGGDMDRDLGTSPVDLDAEQAYFVSLFIRSDDDGLDEVSQEFFDINLLSGVTEQITFGVGSSEAFALNLNGNSGVNAGADTMATGTTYFMLLKIASSSSSDDEVSLAWYDDVNDIPANEGAVTWGLTDTADLSGLLDAIQLDSGSNAIWNADALRIGTTFDSVIFTDGVLPDILGDLTADGLINLDDWLVFKANYGDDTTGLTMPEQEDLGDLTTDGIINLGDFVIFVDQYDLFNGAGAFVALSAAVPEPNAAILLIMGTAVLLFRKW